MLSVFLELSLYSIPGALAAVAAGYYLPEFWWIVAMSLGVLAVSPFVTNVVLGKKSTHPGEMGMFLMCIVQLFWVEIGLWIGYLLQ